MMHAYGQDRAASPTFDTDHAVDVFLHVKKAPAAAGAFYLYARHVLFCHFQIAPLPLFTGSFFLPVRTPLLAERMTLQTAIPLLM